MGRSGPQPANNNLVFRLSIHKLPPQELCVVRVSSEIPDLRYPAGNLDGLPIQHQEFERSVGLFLICLTTTWRLR
jgi:hypothetical protein